MGTRTADCIEGSAGRTAREVKGNGQAEFTAHLALALARAGGHFMIENPFDTYLWKSCWLLELLDAVAVYDVVLCQCAYGLQLPGAAPNCYCLKRTRFWASFNVSSLARGCPGKSATHMHEHAQGSRKVNGVQVKLAAAAGAYPKELCDCIAGLVESNLHTKPFMKRPINECLVSRKTHNHSRKVEGVPKAPPPLPAPLCCRPFCATCTSHISM